ncbi:MAG: MBL fold metallo-hydrolase [Chloroflexi bacterium]|nr:MBL fold metallo-hydrolase [Chloroflexota bacterium]
MQVTFWGTRGSIPVPGEMTNRFGGNTTCVEVRLSDNSLIVFDAGTGIRKLGQKLGNQLVAEGKLPPVNLFLTHSHWDHIQGFPFFSPAHIRGVIINIFGCASNFSKLHEIMSNQMESRYFPVNFNDLSASINFLEINKSPRFESATIKNLLCNHPGDSYAYRIEEGGRVLVFMTDNELTSENSRTEWGEFVNFCRGADLLIHDSQFTPSELELRRGWGHSSHLEAARLACEAGVKSLALFHHDPDHSDRQVEKMIEEAREALAGSGRDISCYPAAEGQTFKISDQIILE